MKNYSKYLISGKTEADWGFYITSIGYSKIDPHQHYPLNREHPESQRFNWNTGRILDGYYIVFITRGKGIFESAATGTHPVNEGNCFLLFPQVWHRYKPDTRVGWEEYWVGFKGAYAHELLKTNFSAEKPFISIGHHDQLLKLFHELIAQIRESAPGYHQLIPGITLQMLGLLFNRSKEEGDYLNREVAIINEARFILRENIQRAETVEELLKELPVSYSKLRKDFKTVTGTSPNQYQLNLRLEKVRELLSNTGLSIGEIAYQTGFESISYLSKMFRKKNGCAPLEYREANAPVNPRP